MSSSAFSLTTSSPGTLSVSGDLTFATATRALSSGRDELQRSHPGLLDLGGVAHVDSAGLATVLAWLSHARTTGQSLSVTNAPAGLRALARVSGVEGLLR